MGRLRDRGYVSEMFFASDNSSPAHPKVIEAVARANEGYAPSYGADSLMEDVRERIRDAFEAPEAAVCLVPTGSAANSLSLAAFCPPWAAIYCSGNSHVQVDECGGPEFYTGGAKLVPVGGEHAKMDPEHLRTALENAAPVGVHNVQRGMVSITNVTEFGAVYSVSEIAELCALAKEWSLPVHMDGARFANAIVSTNASPADMTWRSGVDILSFGGTKNGLIGVEAVVIFDPGKAWEFELRRKRGGHLLSKHRFLSAQMQAYLEDDLWLDMARSANDAAARLADSVGKLSGTEAMPGPAGAAAPDWTAALLHPVEANMIFAEWPRSAHRAAFEGGAKYYIMSPNASLEGPDDERLAARLVCSWCTTDAEINSLLGLLGR